MTNGSDVSGPEVGARGRRSSCDRCLRPCRACICRWVTPVVSEVALLILQHPLERSNAKGSARMLQLSVTGASMVEGETFRPEQLRTLLNQQGRQAVLLYPDTPDERALGIPAPPPFDQRLRADPAALLLVVLDGTWRKSRKMLYQNPQLQALPRLPLRAMPPSHYLIRKAHAPDQLSTLEAGCYALGQLEANAARYAPLLASFERFVRHFALTGGRLNA